MNKKILLELKKEYPDKRITALPEYANLLKTIEEDNEEE